MAKVPLVDAEGRVDPSKKRKAIVGGMIPRYPNWTRNMAVGSCPAGQMQPDTASQSGYRMIAGSARSSRLRRRSRNQSRRQDDVRISARYALYDDKTGNYSAIPKTLQG